MASRNHIATNAFHKMRLSIHLAASLSHKDNYQSSLSNEDQLKQLAIQWFQDTGSNYAHGRVIAPEGVSEEREQRGRTQ
jgi:hypothetical protein